MASATALTPQTKIQALVRDPIFDALEGLELRVYLRLIGAWGEQKSRRVRLINGQLYRDGRTAVRILHQLEQHGLVRLHYPDGRSREIEIL